MKHIAISIEYAGLTLLAMLARLEDMAEPQHRGAA